MKGFVVRHQQALAIGASAAILVGVSGTLTGIILAGRHSPGVATKPSPSATFNENTPTQAPSGTASSSGSATASPGAAAPGATPVAGGPLATPIGFGNGGAGCLGIANCTPAPRATGGGPAAPPVTATYATAKSVSNGKAVAAGTPDGSTIWFTEGFSGFIASVSASAGPTEHQLQDVSAAMGMFFDTQRKHLWVINADSSAPSVVEFDMSTGVPANPVAYALQLGVGKFRSQISPGIAIEGITVDALGDVWFSEFSDATGNPVIGHIRAGDVDKKAITPEQCPVILTATHQQGGHPMSIITGQDGHLYIGTNKGLGKWIQPSGVSCSTNPGTYVENAPAGCGTTPTTAYIESVAVGPDGKAWFGTPLGVGEYNGSTAAMVACNGGGMTGDHMAIVTAPDPSQTSTKALWTAFSSASTTPGVARIFSSTGSAISANDSGADFRAIVSDSSGNLWLADAANGKIIEAKPAKG